MTVTRADCTDDWHRKLRDSQKTLAPRY